MSKKISNKRRMFLKLKLEENDHKIVEEYVTALEEYSGRYSDQAYLAGIRDSIQFFYKMKLIKE